MSNNVVDALNTSDGNVAEAGAWLIDYCGLYSNVVLAGAALFLVGGFVFVAIAARHEAEKAKAEAEKAKAEARKAEAEARRAEGTPDGAQEFFPVTVAVAAAKGFAEALGTAKAWLAMVIIGLLLLWLAGSAPQMCVWGDSDDQQEQASPGGNDGADATEEPGDNADDDAQATANDSNGVPPTEGANAAGSE